MRIKEIKFHSHPILGELMLNFTKDDGSIYDNVIFIGENGVGKSSIIEGMANFLNKKAFDGLEYIKYDVNGEELKAVPVGELGFYDMIKPDEPASRCTQILIIITIGLTMILEIYVIRDV